MKEEVFLAYFSELNKICKPNTLWSRYSMLKSVLKVRRNLDISRFFKVTAYLRKQNVGCKPKKAKVFCKEDLGKFFSEAPDEIYLLIKVAAIFGLAGACRREELTKMSLDDIDDKGNVLVVKIPDSKNHTCRTFVVSNEVNNGIFLSLYRKYARLRKPETPHRRFFVYFKNGLCTVQCVGVNTFGKMPSNIASYLNLPNPELYTGHSFRRSSATILANSGEDITNIKRLGGWKSTSVAEGYLEDSTTHKKNMSNKILFISSPSTSDLHLESATTSSNVPSTSSQSASASSIPSSSSGIGNDQLASASVTTSPSTSMLPFKSQLSPAINLQNATNCSFTINIVNNK